MKKKTRFYLIESSIALIVITIIAIYTIPYFIEAQSINTPTFFPDPHFRKIVEQEMGVEPGGKFTRHDAAQKEIYMGVKDTNVESVKGVEWLKNLREFNCADNQVTEVNLQANTKLRMISITSAPLEELTLPETDSLVDLRVIGCRLKSLDVPQSANLKTLSIPNNRIETLTVHPNNKIDVLLCENNQIKSLNLAQFPHLVELSCQNNPFTSLDVLVAPNLKTLYLSYSQIGDVNRYIPHPSLQEVIIYYKDKESYDRDWNSEISTTMREHFGKVFSYNKPDE